MLVQEGKMSANPSPPDDNPQSFLIRIWRENPRVWRATVRDVRNESLRGFDRLDQALAFIQQRAAAKAARAAQPTARWHLPQLDGLFSRRLQPVWALATILVLVVIALFFMTPGSNVPLSGAAIGGAIGMDLVLAFLLGGIIGGIVVWLWLRIR